MIITRGFTADLEIREDQRQIVGLAVPYGVQIRVGRYFETFRPGAFADADPAPLTATHPGSQSELPIGVSVELRDQPDGLHGVWRVSKTELGDEVLELIRDGAVSGCRSASSRSPTGGTRPQPSREGARRTRSRRRCPPARLPRGQDRRATGRSGHHRATAAPRPNEITVTLARPCLGCGVKISSGSRCDNCAQAKAKTAERGYGARWQQLARQAIRQHPGAPTAAPPGAKTTR